jgi:hypothetical protein
VSGEDASDAHRAAVAAALLGVIGTSISVVGFWSISGPALHVVQGGGIAVNGTALAVLHARRDRTSRRVANALFLLVLVPTMVLTWMVDDARAAHSARWVPYEPNKLSALTLAIIAPPGWATGLVGISMFVGSAIVHHTVLTDGVRARMSAGEPFGVIAYGVFAVVLLGFKQSGHAMRRELERARSEKLALEHVAHLAMAMRDLANTPVQTLELVRQGLLLDGEARELQARRMGRAIDRLRRLNEILMSYQAAVTWNDAGQALDRELARVAAPSVTARPGDDRAGAAPTSRARRARPRPA